MHNLHNVVLNYILPAHVVCYVNAFKFLKQNKKKCNKIFSHTHKHSHTDLQSLGEANNLHLHGYSVVQCTTTLNMGNVECFINVIQFSHEF